MAASGNEIAGHRLDLVAMAHPDNGFLGHALEQAVGVLDVAGSPAELPAGGRLDFATEHVASELHPVADAEHGDIQLEQFRIARWSARLIDTGWPAGEDNAAWPQLGDTRCRQVGRTIWQKTFCSRTRRAMSWPYCDPKSKMRTRSLSGRLNMLCYRFFLVGEICE